MIQYEADPKHGTTLCEAMGVGLESKGLKAPVVKSNREDVEVKRDEQSPELMAGEATRFRGLAATANYLSVDRTSGKSLPTLLRRVMYFVPARHLQPDTICSTFSCLS